MIKDLMEELNELSTKNKGMILNRNSEINNKGVNNN